MIAPGMTHPQDTVEPSMMEISRQLKLAAHAAVDQRVMATMMGTTLNQTRTVA